MPGDQRQGEREGASMKQYHKNPRQITSKEYADLQKWLIQLGDLGGVVHDLNSDEIIGGNQRSRVFDINRCELVVEHAFDEPDEQGTVGLGYVIWQGKRYAYRQVRWDERQCEQANIIANKAGGSWDFDLLANEWDIPDLLDWGFKPYEIGVVGDPDDPNAHWEGMPEFEQENLIGVQSIHVHFNSRQDVDDFAELIGQKLTDKTRSIWYPEVIKIDMKSEIYRNES